MTGLLGMEQLRTVRGEERRSCPRCRVDRDFVRATTRRHLLFAGRPVLPMGTGRDYMECGRCGRTYEADMLESTTSSKAGPARSVDERAILALVAAAIMADSRVRDREKEVARSVLRRHTGRELAGEDFLRLLREVRREIPNPIRYLARLAPVLTESAKTRILEAAYEIASADRELHPAETRLIVNVGEALEVSPMLVRQAMETVRRRQAEERDEGTS